MCFGKYPWSETTWLREQQTVDFKSLAALPEPVVRYFRMVLKDGQPMIHSARLTQSGHFRMSPAGAWKPFIAEQNVSINPPGLQWNARIRIAPLISVRVCDSYIAGKASMRAKIFQIMPIVRQEDISELNAAALQRHLAETPWYPTALLPSKQLWWKAVDQRTAIAYLKDYNLEVSLQFEFNDVGEIARVSTPARYRYVNGKYESAPWAGDHRNYQEVNGIRIPTEATVQWLLPDGDFQFFKGRITNGCYNYK